MKKALFILLFLPFSLLAQRRTDSLSLELQKSRKQIEVLQKEISDLKSRYDFQDKVYENTIDSISSQLGAASYNLAVFGVLFGIAALGLGVYVTSIERKIVKMGEENKSLLTQTKETKEEVVAINDLIQKDINGLFLKIKREETLHILNRLLKVPKDISNLGTELLSIDLERNDFIILREAYLKLAEDPETDLGDIRIKLGYKETYRLIFFQHFLDLAIKDELVGPDMIKFLPIGIELSFENDIIKSTEDFIKAIVDMGYQSKDKEIKSFIEALAASKYKNDENVYRILFNGLKHRDQQFKLYDIISRENGSRIAKSEYGKILIETYSSTDLSQSEMLIIEEIQKVKADLKKEALEKEEAERKKRGEEAEKIRIQREKRIVLNDTKGPL